MDKYRLVIGLEVHSELKTLSKAFCSCKNEVGAIPNTLVCPVCLGLPGASPSINKRAIELTMMAGLALGANIDEEIVFERKNYFYPDLPKGYQICQLRHPIATGGVVEIAGGKRIRLNRIHLEENAGKLLHTGDGRIYVDFNRSGAPILEIVSEPDFSSSKEVIEFISTLRNILMFSGVSDCRMETGGYRFDINLSVQRTDSAELGTRIEMKNLTSFKDVEMAIDYEFQRHIEILEAGEEVSQETRGWDAEKMQTYSVRRKESENDYRHFPDTDLPTITISKEDISRVASELPESYAKRREKYFALGLTKYDVDLLMQNKYLADYFDRVNALTNEPKETANWILTEILALAKNVVDMDYDYIISSSDLALIINMLGKSQISRTNAKEVLLQVVETGKKAKFIVRELGLWGDVDDEDIEEIINALLSENPGLKADYLNSPEVVSNHIIGEVISRTNGKARAEKVLEILARIVK